MSVKDGFKFAIGWKLGSAILNVTAKKLLSMIESKYGKPDEEKSSNEE